ncbi:hypothetical protein DASB73_022840 [Starmerella bacillaris]|uniref:Uncharacterized protein n=1 Tax=Starmerella bacillaris TaxID=1247836 RepID=A0AAV5RL22_STABA|nr:hypothetical protein DASB73_022840 [Starmerella bacillaris]
MQSENSRPSTAYNLDITSSGFPNDYSSNNPGELNGDSENDNDNDDESENTDNKVALYDVKLSEHDDLNDEDLGFTVSEGNSDDDGDMQDFTGLDLRDESALFSDNDINEFDLDLDNLNDLDGFDDVDIDDTLIEAEEERAIQQDFKPKRPLLGPVSARRLSVPPESSDEEEEENISLKKKNDKHFRVKSPSVPPVESIESDQSEPEIIHNHADDTVVSLDLNTSDPVHYNDESLESSSSEALSEGSTWGTDLLDDFVPANRQPKAQTSSFYEQDNSDSDADDSYLLQYFFSSGDENNPESDADEFDVDDVKLNDDHGDTSNTDEDLPFGSSASRKSSRSMSSTSQQAHSASRLPRNPLANDEDNELHAVRSKHENSASSVALPAQYVPSGDSTDEDDVPPERKRRRAKGTKAIEVLGANSYSTRPPVLGSWEIDKQKNVGIIDGRTTRTLSPPQDDGFDESMFDMSQDAVNDFTDFSEYVGETKPKDIELADFINTDNMSSDGETFEFPMSFSNNKHPLISPYLYRGRLNRSVSTSQALRNKGSPFVNNQAFPNDEMSPAPKRVTKNRRLRESPMRRKSKKRGAFRSLSTEPSFDEGNQDFIGELIEIGAISPYYDVNT